MEKTEKTFLEIFRELRCQGCLEFFEAIGEGLTAHTDFGSNGLVGVPQLTELTDLDGLGHQLIDPVEDLVELHLVGNDVLYQGCGVFQVIDPGLLTAIFVGDGVVEGEVVSGTNKGTGGAVHVAVENFALGAHAATVVLLLLAVGVDVAVEAVELLLGDGDALLGGAEIDVVLLFIGCHMFVLSAWTVRRRDTKKPVHLMYTG